MDKGLTLASMLNDVPISPLGRAGQVHWRPKTPRRSTPDRFVYARLGQSKNVVMVRAMRAMGVDYAAEYSATLRLPGAASCMPNRWRWPGLLHADAGCARLVR